MSKQKGYRGVDPDPDKYVRRSLEKVGKKRDEHLKRALLGINPMAFSVYNGSLVNYNSNKMNHPMPPRKVGAKIQEIRILKGGALDAPGEKVNPGPLSRVAGPPAKIPLSPGGRRLALAEWIAHPDNALAARVIVNRAWQHHFGNRGIVPTPDLHWSSGFTDNVAQPSDGA